MSAGGWRFWVDRGGTFTDVIGLSPEGRLTVCKLLSDAGTYADAASEGIRRLLQWPAEQSLAAAPIAEIRMGTTVATNALLEHKCAPVVLVTTAGFRDLLEIGYQNRPDLFALDIQRPALLYQDTIEAYERISHQGSVLQPLDSTALESALLAAHSRGQRSCAIVFLHAYRNPAHEREAARIARAVGFEQITCSSDCSHLPRVVARGNTAVLDACLSPVLREYIQRLQHGLSTGSSGPSTSDQPARNFSLEFMQSSGGLVPADRFHGRNAVLSGPAGGVIGMARTAGRAGFKQLIGFDMGGTSTDVSHFDDEYDRVHESLIAGRPVQVPMLDVHTIAAGGGSILGFRDGRYQVGPASAGAQPGPACYGLGGPLTVTDCNLLLGRIQPTGFPRVFGPDGRQALDAAATRRGFTQLAAQIESETGATFPLEAIAEGFLAIADQAMAHAIERISTRRGRDLKHYTLCSYGGAGGQHACHVAELLGLHRIYLHPLGGVLSACGIGLADHATILDESLELPLETIDDSILQPILTRLSRRAASALGVDQSDSTLLALHERIRLVVRQQGSEIGSEIEIGESACMRAQWIAAFQSRFGFQPAADSVLIAAAVRVEYVLSNPLRIQEFEAAHRPVTRPARRSKFARDLPSSARIVHKGIVLSAPVTERHEIRTSTVLAGPALVQEETGTLWIAPGWRGELLQDGALLLTRPNELQPDSANQDCPRSSEFAEGQNCRASPGTDGDSVTHAAPLTADPATLEVFNHLFQYIAGQMGEVLQSCAVSVNIRERLDYSCALFSADGALVANAPHVPVHLGSMGHSVRAVMEHFAADPLQPGDVALLNDPYTGGTHLPDLTVVLPVWAPTASGAAGVPSRRPQFFLAARGHHADIGGICPGSMPAASQRIEEEGVLIQPMRLVCQGIWQQQALDQVLQAGAWPARNPQQVASDLKAQVAACHAGQTNLLAVCHSHGLPTVQRYMAHIRSNAADALRKLVPALKPGAAREQMDSGGIIAVCVTPDPSGQLTIDFTGSSATHSGNFNAPLAVVHAAVLYVLRCLLDRDIPLNEGCMDSVKLIVPAGSCLNPAPPAAVVAGNVEVSQIVVDCLFQAFGVKAAAQGTMNNLTFGTEDWQYYETVCGGDGASSRAAGCSAVHTHMTNSRLTDPEILEQRYPVRLETFQIRSLSGGTGKWKGGDGVIRSIRFLEPARISLLANRHQHGAPGLSGGGSGQPGRFELIRRDADTPEQLPSRVTLDLGEGDLLTLHTPGGGGFGRGN